MTDSAPKSGPFTIPVSREDLLADLRRVSWAHDAALRRAGDAVARRLEETWADCLERAKQLGHPAERLVRNVIAEAPSEALPYWRLVLQLRVLRHGEARFVALVEALPPGGSEWALPGLLLAGVAEPTEAEYADFFGADDVGISAGLLETAFRKARPGVPPVSAVLRLALGSLPADRDGAPDLSPERLALLEETFALGPELGPVTGEILLSLPAPIRPALACREELLAQLGGPALVQEVRRHLQLRKDLAAGLQRAGLESLRVGRFHDHALQLLVEEHPNGILIDEKHLVAALNGHGPRRDPGRGIARRLARLVRLSPSHLRPALQILLARRSARSALFVKLGKKQLGTVLSVLPIRDLPVDIRIARFFKEGFESDLPGLRHETADKSRAELRRAPAWAVLGGLENAFARKYLPAVARAILWDAECLRAIAEKAGPGGRRVLAAVVKRVEQSREFAEEFLPLLLGVLPAWGLRAVSPSLPAEVVLRALRASAEDDSLTRKILVQAGRGPQGEALVDQVLAASSVLPPRTFHLLLAEASRPHLRLLRLLPKHLDLLLPLALEKIPLRDLLPLALEHLAVARALEKKYSRLQLRAEIPWVRRHHRMTPHLAAAYELALAIGLTRAGQLRGLAAKAATAAGGPRGSAFDALYRCYELPKKSGGNRTVTVPADALKSLQRRLLRFGFAEIPLHEAATGFRSGLSIRDNALPHVGKPLVVNVDIASFFPSTRYELVLRACRKLLGGKISPAAARLVADLCSFRGALPTGAPTSPTIANIVLTPLDKALGKVCVRHGISYTRYADDLTFSGGSEAKKVLPFVHRLLDQLGYRLDGKKTNLFRRGRRQVVTGLVVNDKPNLPRRLRRKLRAAVDQRVRSGQATWHGRPVTDDTVLGLIAHLNLVQPEEARRHRLRLEAVRTKKVHS